jgi:hypothetical protein
MKRTQIMLSRCVVCHEVYACYDSNRSMAKKQCKNCKDVCPNPTHNDSHGFCDKHFQEAIERIQERMKHLEE